MSVTISAAFDSGNIELLAPAAPGAPIRLAIRGDAGGAFFQWFHFRAAGAPGVELELRIENAGRASYPVGWEGYRACVSEDRLDWRRAETVYQGGQLIIRHTPRSGVAWFAYFAPYSQERHHDLVARAALGGARHEALGRTLDGWDMDRLTFGSGPLQLWVVARQHPGESMASWWMEGFVDRLLDGDDPAVRALLERATVSCVPMMNPDGAARGYLRTNACGANLNREWEAPTADRSPEVLCVRDAMDASGVDLCLDVHGDEGLPYNFLSGAEGIAGWTPRLAGLSSDFRAAYIRAHPDLQARHGYPRDAPGAANMTMCTSQVAQRFDCLAYTLEMPFKDNADARDAARGWSPARCRRLGRAAVDAARHVLDDLRG